MGAGFFAILLLLVGTACAAPMRLTVRCSDSLVIVADVTPGMTEVSGSTWQQRAGETVTCKATLLEADRK